MRHVGEGWRRRARRRAELFRAPDLWPLVGIAIVLLIVMMVGIPTPHHGIAADLVRIKHAQRLPGTTREDAMRVVVTRDGRVYFGNAQIQTDELPEKLRERLRAGAEKRVYMQVDSRAQYGDVRTVLNEVNLAGVEKVSFVTQ